MAIHSGHPEAEVGCELARVIREYRNAGRGGVSSKDQVKPMQYFSTIYRGLVWSIIGLMV